MATYKEIQKYIKSNNTIYVKSCWIAHMKEICGLNPKKAPNRKSKSRRSQPCPPSKMALIKDAFKHYKMI
jgi:hypothetical protein